MRAKFDSQTGSSTNTLVEWLRSKNIPVTRENYLVFAYPTGLPDPWTPELEAELPPELQIQG